MDADGYLRWLLSSKGLKRATCLSRVSNCAKVERYEGDLDAFYAQDRLGALLARLTYTTDDERRDARSKHSIPVKGNLRRTTATLKSAVVLYRDFRDSQHLDVLLASHSQDETAHLQRHMLWGTAFMHRYPSQLESLHNDAIFSLLVDQVDRELVQGEHDELEQITGQVFARCEPERRFAELKGIVDDVVDSGYRVSAAYVSVYCAMKILDLARG